MAKEVSKYLSEDGMCYNTMFDAEQADFRYLRKIEEDSILSIFEDLFNPEINHKLKDDDYQVDQHDIKDVILGNAEALRTHLTNYIKARENLR